MKNTAIRQQGPEYNWWRNFGRQEQEHDAFEDPKSSRHVTDQSSEKRGEVDGDEMGQRNPNFGRQEDVNHRRGQD